MRFGIAPSISANKTYRSAAAATNPATFASTPSAARWRVLAVNQRINVLEDLILSGPSLSSGIGHREFIADHLRVLDDPVHGLGRVFVRRGWLRCGGGLARAIRSDLPGWGGNGQSALPAWGGRIVSPTDGHRNEPKQSGCAAQNADHKFPARRPLLSGSGGIAGLRGTKDPFINHRIV